MPDSDGSDEHTAGAVVAEEDSFEQVPADEPETGLGALAAVQNLINSPPSCTEFVETPPQMQCQLLSHQKAGLDFMCFAEHFNKPTNGGILADESGLGKTIQAIATMFANQFETENRATLVVVPLSLKQQWLDEYERILHKDYKRNGKKYKSFQFSKRTCYRGHATFKDLTERQFLVVTTYGKVVQEHSDMKAWEKNPTTAKRPDFPLFDGEWFRVILDESHEIND